MTGKLRIFLGISSGVGKTYKMLHTAKNDLTNGKDVILGTINTHDHPQLEKLVSQIPQVDKIEKVKLGEINIDFILERKPQLVIIDELEHSNSNGQRNPKRWQDIIEILDKGIDVYTTANVTSIESRKHDIEKVTGISITETIPDIIFDQAELIDVIDISAHDLLRRINSQDITKKESLYNEQSLNALREMMFRISADKLDKNSENLNSEKNEIWKTKEKILTLIDNDPKTGEIIRRARQMASSLKTPWCALYVDTGKLLNDQEQKMIMTNIDLARELGAKILTLSDTSWIKGIEKACLQQNISQIVISSPKWKSINRMFPTQKIIKKLNSLNDTVSVHLVKSASKSEEVGFFEIVSNKLRMLPNFILVTIIIMILGTINAYIHHKLGVLPYHSIGLLFLLQVTFIGMFFSVGQTIWASVLASQIWNVFFIPPLYRITIDSPDDIALCVSFIFIASIVGVLTSTNKRGQTLLKSQEKRTNTLYQLSTLIVESKDKSDVLEKISFSLSKYFNGKVSINTKNVHETLDHFKKGSDWAFNNNKEWSVIQWCFENKKIAGKWTTAHSSAKSICVPLLAREEIMGVLVYMPKHPTANIGVNDKEVLITISSQLGLFLQRELFHERTLETEKLKESEMLHQTLLNSVSHEIKTPLTAITGIVEAIHDKTSTDSMELNDLRKSLMESVDRLKQVVENILDMSRLESGVLKLKEEWVDFTDIVDNVCSSLKYSLDDFSVNANIPDDFPLVYIDAKLMEQVFQNLLLNSIKYCPPHSQIEINAKENNDTWEVDFSDNGEGVPEDDKFKIFDKFYRGKNIKHGGTGLGLTIVKNIINLHRGTIAVQPSHKGFKLKIVLPLQKAPVLPEEFL